MFIQVNSAADLVRLPIITSILIALIAFLCHPATARAEDDLITAAKTGNMALAKKTVRRGADVNAVGQYGRTALHLAAENNHAGLVALLIEAGADVNKHEGDNVPPLIAMVSSGNAEISRLLLDAGADLTVTKGKSNDPISILADWSNPELARVLKSYDVDINAPNKSGYTVAHRQTDKLLTKLNFFVAKLIQNPAYDRKKELREVLRIYRAFFDAGADPDARNKDGRTPLMMLARSGQSVVEASQVLLDAGADPNIRDSDGHTALDIASSARKIELVTLLAKGGGNPNSDPLILFEALQSEDRLRLLLEAGADPNAVVDVCVSSGAECDKDNTANVVSRHILLHAVSRMGWSVVHEGDKERIERKLGIIRMLLVAGSDPNTDAPKNALWLVLKHGRNARLVKLLLEFGATLEGMGPPIGSGKENVYLPHAPYQLRAFDTDAYSGETRSNKRGIVVALLDSGADPNDAHPETGMTPLRIAVRKGEIGIVRALIDAGADIAGDVVDGTPILAAAITARHKNRHLVKRVCAVPDEMIKEFEKARRQSCENAKQFVKDQQTIIAELVQKGAPVKTAVGEEIRRLVGRGTALARLVGSDEDYGGVIKEFEKARDVEPLWPPIYYRLGAVEEAAGNHPKALEYFEMYLALAPGSERAREVQGKIYELEVMAERYVSAQDALIMMYRLSRGDEYYDNQWRSSGKPPPRTGFVNFSQGDGGTVHIYNNVFNQKKQSRVKIDGNTFHWSMTIHICPGVPDMPHNCPIHATNECTVVTPKRVVCKGREHLDFAEASGQTNEFTWEYNHP